MPDEFPPTPDRRFDDARPSRDDRSSRDERPSSDSPPTGPDRPSRRSFLASAGSATAGLAVTAGLGATAGCVELLPPLGQEFSPGSVSPPDRGSPRFHRYLPASQDDSARFEPGVVALPNADVAGPARFDWTPGRSWFVETLDFFGVGFENYDLAVSVSTESAENEATAIALEGPVVPEEVGPLLRESGYRADGARGRFDRFVRSDVPRTVAVTDGLLLFGKGAGRERPITAVHEAVEGEPAPAPEDGEYRRFLRDVGQPARLHFFDSTNFTDQYSIDRIIKAYDADGESWYDSDYLLYEDETPSYQEIRDELVDTGDAEAIEIDISGRRVSVRRRLPISSIASDLLDSEPSGTTPHVTWGGALDDDTVVLRHEAGDPIPAEDLRVEATDSRREWSPTDAQFADQYSTVGPGDTLRVPTSAASDGERVRIVFDTGDDRFPDELFSYGP